MVCLLLHWDPFVFLDLGEEWNEQEDWKEGRETYLRKKGFEEVVDVVIGGLDWAVVLH